MLFGTTQFGLGLLLMTVGTRLISATRSALIGSMEDPLAPLWGWLAFGEKPTWIGGSLVMGVGVIDIATKSKRHRNAFKVPAESAFAKLPILFGFCARNLRRRKRSFHGVA